jgi:aminotransferase in exopolysaccharide biosynthesis
MFEEIVEFIRSLYPGRDFIPLHEPCFRGNEKKYLEECIDSTFVSSVGKFVDSFEKKVEEYTGAKKAVVIVNGTEALHFALKLVGVSQDDEVITQPLTFIATANAIVYCNAHPVFIDVDLDTLGMSSKSLSEFLEATAEMKKDGCYNRLTKRRIRACVPMHTFGHPCRIDEIVEICTKWNIEVVEDAAESIGSTYKGRHTGTFGHIGVLSFNGNKTITTGGGGMLITNDIELGNHAKYLSTQAKVPHPWEYVHDEIGYNYRMPNLNAALGIAQLEQLDSFIENKRSTAKRYQDFFKLKGISFFAEPERARSNYWLNAILLKDLNEQNEFLKFTNGHCVMTRPAWKLLHKLPMYENCLKNDLNHAECIEDRLVNIPSSFRNIYHI